MADLAHSAFKGHKTNKMSFPYQHYNDVKINLIITILKMVSGPK